MEDGEECIDSGEDCEDPPRFPGLCSGVFCGVGSGMGSGVFSLCFFGGRPLFFGPISTDQRQEVGCESWDARSGMKKKEVVQKGTKMVVDERKV